SSIPSHHSPLPCKLAVGAGAVGAAHCARVWVSTPRWEVCSCSWPSAGRGYTPDGRQHAGERLLAGAQGARGKPHLATSDAVWLTLSWSPTLVPGGSGAYRGNFFCLENRCLQKFLPTLGGTYVDMWILIHGEYTRSCSICQAGPGCVLEVSTVCRGGNN